MALRDPPFGDHHPKRGLREPHSVARQRVTLAISIRPGSGSPLLATLLASRHRSASLSQPSGAAPRCGQWERCNSVCPLADAWGRAFRLATAWCGPRSGPVHLRRCAAEALGPGAMPHRSGVSLGLFSFGPKRPSIRGSPPQGLLFCCGGAPPRRPDQGRCPTGQKGVVRAVPPWP